MKGLEQGFCFFAITLFVTLAFSTNYVSYSMKLNDSENKGSKKKVFMKVAVSVFVFLLIVVSKNYVTSSNKVSTPEIQELGDAYTDIDRNLDAESEKEDTKLELETQIESDAVTKNEKDLKNMNENNSETSESKEDVEMFNSNTTAKEEDQNYKKGDNFTISVAVAGDTTLGYDSEHGYESSFMHEFERQEMDYGYFLGGIKDIFKESDISMVNLEGVLTDYDSDREMLT